MLRILRKLSGKNVAFVFVCALFIFAQVWLDLTLPDYMSEITMLLQTQGSQMSEILKAGAMMLLCALGSLVCSVVVSVVVAAIAADFSASLRTHLFNKVQSFSMAEIGNFSTPSLITRSTNDVMQVQMLLVMGMQVLIKAPVTAVWAIIKISDKSSEWTITTAVAVVVLFIIIGTCIALSMPKFRKLQRLTDDVNRVTRENLTGIRVVRAYNAESYQQDKFESVNDELTRANVFTARVMSTMMPSITLVNNMLVLSVYFIGAVIIDRAALADKAQLFSDMLVFSSYAMQIVMSFMMLVMIFILLPRASVAAKRILEVLDTKLSIQDGHISQIKGSVSGEIEFKNVSFKYPGADSEALRDINFHARRGQTVAIIGSTGCGKSTLVNLIPRFYDVCEGQVLVDGVDVRDYTQYALRCKIGYVSQKAVLFSGTVESNIAYGDCGKGKISRSDVEDAVYTAQASEFVEGLSEGYEGYVAQAGSNFSGGQKQRLSIARAVARYPEILIFDDSFSALDYKTDRKLREALKSCCSDATKIIVAQRIGTIRDADMIIVLDEGRMAGIGTHESLMQECEVYRQIAYSQLSKEELG